MLIIRWPEHRKLSLVNLNKPSPCTCARANITLSCKIKTSVTWFIGNESIQLPLNWKRCTNTRKSVVGVMVTYENSYLCCSSRSSVSWSGTGKSDGHVFASNLRVELGGVSTIEILTIREGSFRLSFYSRSLENDPTK